jgi:4-hydroxyphenylpyruvate dioxygenase
VDDVESIFGQAIKRGATIIQNPERLTDEYGSVQIAAIKTYGDTVHTLLQRSAYRGAFLPGYRVEIAEDPVNTLLPGVNLDAIDHCVGNMDWNGMEETCK